MLASLSSGGFAMLCRATAFFTLLFATACYPCSVLHPVSSTEMVRESDAIVVVTAEGYSAPPKDPRSWNGFITPDSKVRFKITETIRGKLSADYLVLPGILVQTDDFNDAKSPYNFVRPGGRHGNCYAYTYRAKGQFLLMLKKDRDGELTVYWYALGPVNEQLHSLDDPWLLWVREQVNR
jgi:hypothetical protein